MSDKYAELRRLAEATYAEGEQWYDSSSIAALPGCICDERYVIKANPSTILSLLDELEACMDALREIDECQDNDVVEMRRIARYAMQEQKP